MPNSLGSLNYNELLRLSNLLCNDVNHDIVCDACGLSFVDPLALCVLAATCHKLSVRGKNVTISGLSKKLHGYMARMDFFENCHIDDVDSRARHDRRVSLVEIKRLDDCGQVGTVSNQIADAIVGQIPGYEQSGIPDEMDGYTPSDRLNMPLQYVFSELLENALTHGRRRGRSKASVWVACQYYRSRDLIALSIVDDGCGYLETLSSHPKLIANDHSGAIQTALMPKVSCNKELGLNGDPVNQGIGLTVVHDLVLAAQGKLIVCSGNASAEIGAQRQYRECNESWNGVMIYIEFGREQLKDVNIHSLIRPYQPVGEEVSIRFE